MSNSTADDPFHGRSFQTSARRRGGKPIRLRIEGWEQDYDDEDDDGHAVEVTLTVDPRVDVVRLGQAFGAFGKSLQVLKDPNTDEVEKLRILDDQVPTVRKAIRECLLVPSRAKFDEVADGLDIQALGEVVRFMSNELTGQGPTQDPSSSDGSLTTGSSSTDGAPVEEPTPSGSPSPDA